MPSVKKIFVSTLLAITLLLPILVFAADKYGASATADKTDLARMSISNATPSSLASQIVTLVLGLTATIFFLMVLYGGITWMTAQGAPDKVNRAKDILITAIIGLVIVAGSYAISVYIFSKISSSGGCSSLGGSCRSDCAVGESMDFTATDCGDTKTCCIP